MADRPFGSLAMEEGQIDPLSGVPLSASPRAHKIFNAIADHFAYGARDFFQEFGKQAGTVASDRTPEEMDAAARGMAPGVALGMLGLGRIPGGAPAGSVGSSGARLTQPEGIRAYHGSPHDFDRFDISKIGTGEGAQSYGHGLYFAENEGVARRYRDTLAPRRSKMPDDVISMPMDSRRAFMAHVATDADPMTAAKRAQYMASALRQEDVGKLAGLVEQVREAQRGRMYEVNINAKPEQFLDWDRPLAQMSPEVQSRLKDAWLAHPEAHARQTGEGLYGTLEAQNWDSRSYRGAGKPEATRQLREAGIPGIRYLDQGSRRVGVGGKTDDLIASVMDSAGGNKARALSEMGSRLDSVAGLAPQYQSAAGISQLQEAMELLRSDKWKDTRSRNLVVFDPGIIDIMRKYALPGAVGGGAAFGSLAPGEQQ